MDARHGAANPDDAPRDSRIARFAGESVARVLEEAPVRPCGLADSALQPGAEGGARRGPAGNAVRDAADGHRRLSAALLDRADQSVGDLRFAKGGGAGAGD